MQGASGLDCGNECNQVIFNSVWSDIECWKIAVKLLSDGKVALKGCKSKKTGKTYDTTVIMTVDEKQRAVFELNFEKGADKYGKSKNKKD